MKKIGLHNEPNFRALESYRRRWKVQDICFLLFSELYSTEYLFKPDNLIEMFHEKKYFDECIVLIFRTHTSKHNNPQVIKLVTIIIV